MNQAYPMYDERFEHEACGIGAVVDLQGTATHRTVSDALTIVERLAHRAGCDAAGTTGDGVGIMTCLPHALFKSWAQENGIHLGADGAYGVGMLFLPKDEVQAQRAMREMEKACCDEGVRFLGWRAVPTEPRLLGEGALRTQPCIRQCFVARPTNVQTQAAFDRVLYLVRRAFEKARPDAYVCSLSCRTIVYKGMMLVSQLRGFYLDLQSELYASVMAMVHSRFSTNTEPSWAKAHPHRLLLHNGEINTIRGNADRMFAREETMRSSVYGARLKDLYPVIAPGGSDSAMLDNTLEFMTMNAVPLPLAGMILVPEAWRGERQDTPWQAMYHYYATMMEPWDGPAAVLYSDGDTLCAMLDRNGLRPLRCLTTDEHRLVLSSEAGVLYEEEPHVVRRWRLQAGELLSVDLKTGALLQGEALKAAWAGMHPYQQWVKGGILRLTAGISPAADREAAWKRKCRAFGYTHEDVREILIPMAERGVNPIGSMGADEPPAALSKAHPPLYSYFKQRFAQVTNPPIDALREKSKTDTTVYIGDAGNVLEPAAAQCRVLELPSPVLTSEELTHIRKLNREGFKVCELSMCYPTGGSMEQAIQNLLDACDSACEAGMNILLLSDRRMDAAHLAMPTLLAVSAIEQHLVRTKKRMRVSVVVETADVRDAHQAAMLIGFGARAIVPYLAYACIAELCQAGQIKKTAQQAITNYIRALTDGVLQIASKMGVSTLQAYQSAQLFEAVGLNVDFVERYFTNTPRRLGGIGIEHIEEDVRWHHDHAFAAQDETLDNVGFHRLRRGPLAEEHLYTPETIHTLQRAVQENDEALFAQYAQMVDDQGTRTLRSLLDFRFDACTPVALEEVEPAAQIVHRFKTGAMSYGSLSQEAHECLAQAMNRIGGKSNTGEGGEAKERFNTDRSSAIKQVASGRFGVTAEYLRSAKEIQIKMAQGAKPGEGGHLPGAKVKPWIAATRCSTPGISLISPPPHHDIYSIEDLAQLIYDLKCVNPQADISVKLVSSCGVGTVAAGVVKAGAQAVLISGGEGGTGAAPLTSIHHAGLPWELGLAEAHQTLCKNGLRSRVRLETDGKLMTGRDVAVAVLLGAEEFAFATAPLVAMGCRMMRVCDRDTCPFGIATQDPELRKRFKGKPEYVERFMFFVAEQLRRIMAGLGMRTVDDMVGRGELLAAKADCPLDMTEIIGRSYPQRFEAGETQASLLHERMDTTPSCAQVTLHTTDRSFGAMLPSASTPVRIVCSGCAGQSFGAFVTHGYRITLYGEANDYVGKGLDGGELVICPPKNTIWHAEDALIGNVALFGATGGKAFIAGTAGERFCVRNSGACAVAEGVGDHGCEYMTGGRAVVLGPIGRNFAAGMSGGIAYVWDEKGNAQSRINRQSVEIMPVEGAFEQELYALLEEHEAATRSAVAALILSQWQKQLSYFKMIIPVEYKKLLEGR